MTDPEEEESDDFTIALYVPPLFQTGQIVATPGALSALREANSSPSDLLARHLSGNWGDLSENDKAANGEAVKSGEERIHSSYSLPNGKTVWIITEWDRSVTTILLPIDY